MFISELEEIGIFYKGGGIPPDKDVSVACPKCTERKLAENGRSNSDRDLSVNFVKGVYNCHNGNCSFSGSVQHSKWTKPKMEVRATNTDLADYLSARGITLATAEKLGIGYQNGNIYFNYYENKVLRNYKWRSLDKTKMGQSKNAKKILYNVDSLKDKTKAIICEGELDCAALVQAGLDESYGIVSIDQGAGIVGSKLDGKLQCLENSAEAMKHIEEWVIFLDLDEAGIYTAKEVIRRIGRSKCKLIPDDHDMKDANDFIHPKNKGMRYWGDLVSLVHRSLQVPVPGVHIIQGDLQKSMYKYFLEGKPKAVKSYVLPPENFKWLPGAMTLYYGRPASGKSQFLRFMAFNMAKKEGWKWCCYCPEDYPVYDFYDDLCHMYLRKNVEEGYNNRATFEEYRDGLEWIKDKFIAINPARGEKNSMPNNEWLNERIAFTKLKFGVNAYMKDPWNKIRHNWGNRDDRYLEEELAKEARFAEDFSAACYVAHPKIIQKNKDGQYPRPFPNDISGGAMWNNHFYNIFCVHRPHYYTDPSDRLTQVFQDKVKKQKRAGVPKDHTFMYVPSENIYTTEFNTEIDSVPNNMSRFSSSNNEWGSSGNIHEKHDDLPF